MVVDRRCIDVCEDLGYASGWPLNAKLHVPQKAVQDLSDVCIDNGGFPKVVRNSGALEREIYAGSPIPIRCQNGEGRGRLSVQDP